MRPIGIEELLPYFLSGEGNSNRFIGAEFEVVGFDLSTVQPVSYAGDKGVHVVLQRMVDAGWAPEVEDNNIVALQQGQARVTLEPGCQVELSTPPRVSAHELVQDLSRFRQTLSDASEGLDIAWIGIGLNPVSKWEDISLVPKKRYDIMTNYLKGRGPLALDMMRCTQSVHVTLDYHSEEEAGAMAQAANLATPLAAGIFASSPFRHGQAVSHKSFRAEIWRNTDSDRCGLDADALSGQWSYARYLERLMSLPLIFSFRDGHYKAANGLSVRKYFQSGFEGVVPEVGDLEWVINQTFPEVRMRRYIECRGVDMPSVELAPLVAAFWAGLLYEESSRSQVCEMMSDYTFEELMTLHTVITSEGLGAKGPKGASCQELAGRVLDLARDGLKSRGLGEENLLDGIQERVADGRVPADDLLDTWEGPAGKDMTKLLEQLRIA